MSKKSNTYSHSKLSTFEQCKQKFKFRYIDKIIPEIAQTIEALLGSCVHETLEWLYKQIKRNTIPTLDETIIFYSRSWQEKFTPEILIVKKNLEAKDYFNKGVNFLINYYTKNQPFDDNTLEVEKRVKLDLDEEKKYKILGFIDRLALNPTTGEYEIHDYKTADTMPDKEKINNDRQLALYSLAIKQIYGLEKEVCLIWHYLAHDAKICIKKTQQELENLKHETIKLIKLIEDTTRFPPKVSKLCDWCEYKNICPAWIKKKDEENKNVKRIELKPGKQKSLDDYPTIKKYIKK